MDDKPVACTWKSEAECGDCHLKVSLGCRYSKRDFWFFTLNQVPVMTMALFSLVFIGVLAGMWWALILYVAAGIVFFGLGLETRVICSHCPYWTADSKKLNCWAYPNTPKFWRYRPGPMNWLEKATLIFFFCFLGFFPVLMILWGIWLVASASLATGALIIWGLAGTATATLLAVLQFFYILKFYYCSRCVNFACPFNRVSIEIRRAYLDKNPVMKEALKLP